MKVLFATTNPAKVGKYKELLKEKGIDLITIKDLDFKIDVNENGKDAIENAYIKAKAYYDVTKIPTIEWIIIYLLKNYLKKNNQEFM